MWHILLSHLITLAFGVTVACLLASITPDLPE
jgi:hypothetical protein